MMLGDLKRDPGESRVLAGDALLPQNIWALEPRGEGRTRKKVSHKGQNENNCDSLKVDNSDALSVSGRTDGLTRFMRVLFTCCESWFRGC